MARAQLALIFCTFPIHILSRSFDFDMAGNLTTAAVIHAARNLPLEEAVGEECINPTGAPTDLLGDAVLMDSRSSPRASLALLNARAHLPSLWTVHFFTDPSTIDSIVAVWRDQAPHTPWCELLLRWLGMESLQMHPLPTEISGKLTKVTYNLYLARKAFWDLFHNQWLLLFEADSALCSQPSWPFERFLRMQPSAIFWGAPWKGGATWQKIGIDVGNSGLSLWRRDAMENVSTEFERYSHRKLGYTFAIDRGVHDFLGIKAASGSLSLPQHASKHDAAYFSVETYYPAIQGSLPQEAGQLLASGTCPAEADSGNADVQRQFYTPFGVHAPFRLIGTQGVRCFKALIRHCPAACGLYASREVVNTSQLAELAVRGGRYLRESTCFSVTSSGVASPPPHPSSPPVASPTVVGLSQPSSHPFTNPSTHAFPVGGARAAAWRFRAHEKAAPLATSEEHLAREHLVAREPFRQSARSISATACEQATAGPQRPAPWHCRPMHPSGCIVTTTHRPHWALTLELLKALYLYAVDTVPVYVVLGDPAEAAEWSSCMALAREEAGGWAIAPHETLDLASMANSTTAALARGIRSMGVARTCGVGVSWSTNQRQWGHMKKLLALHELGTRGGCKAAWVMDAESRPLRRFSFAAIFSRLGIVLVRNTSDHEQTGLQPPSRYTRVDTECLQLAYSVHQVEISIQYDNWGMHPSPRALFTTSTWMIDGARACTCVLQDYRRTTSGCTIRVMPSSWSRTRPMAAAGHLWTRCFSPRPSQSRSYGIPL